MKVLEMLRKQDLQYILLTHIIKNLHFFYGVCIVAYSVTILA